MTIFGPIIPPHDVEQAVLSCLQKWQPTYLAEVERQVGRDEGSLPRPRSWTTRSTFDPIPGDERMPMVVVVVPGLRERPLKQGGGLYRARWVTRIFTVVSVKRSPANDPRTIAGYYGAAVRANLLQRKSLEGFARGIDWADEDYGELDEDGRRTLGLVMVEFDVEVDNVVQTGAGPVEPDPAEDPLDPYDEWPVVDEDKITIEGEQL